MKLADCAVFAQMAGMSFSLIAFSGKPIIYIYNDEYEERINKVDCGSFTPMVMSSSGGMGPRMTMALKQLATRTAERTNQRLSVTFALLRSRFVFCLLRSALVCLRGSRSIRRPKSPASHQAPADLAASELKLKI